MKNILLCSIIAIHFFVTTNTASANIVVPGLADGFLYSLSALFFSSSILVFLLPILMGLLFARKFVLVWHFLMFFVAILTVAIFIKDGFLILGGMYVLVLTLLLSFLYASFFTIIAYVASTVGAKFEKIRKVQNILNRSKYSMRLPLIFLVYTIALTPMAFISESNPFQYLYHPGIVLGIIASLIVATVFFILLYKKSTLLPERNFINQRKEGSYLTIIVLLFFGAFVLSFILYPGSYPSIPPPPSESEKILAPDGNRYHNIYEQIEVNGEIAFVAQNIISYMSHGRTRSEFFLVQGDDVRQYPYPPGRLSAIDNKLTYFFPVDVRDPQTGYNKPEYHIRHGDEVYGTDHEIISSRFIDFDDKVTYLAKKQISQASSDLSGGNGSSSEVTFLVQNGKIVSDYYESAEDLRIVEDKLVYSFKKDGLWYLNVSGTSYGTGYDKIQREVFLNGIPAYLVEHEGKIFLVYNNEILSEKYEARLYKAGRLKISNRVAQFTVETNERHEQKNIKIDLSAYMPKVLAPDGNRYHEILDEIEVDGKIAFVAKNYFKHTNMGYHRFETLVVYGNESRQYHSVRRLEIINGKLTYGFSVSSLIPPYNTYENQNLKYYIRHGEKIFGLDPDYIIHGHFYEFDNKVTYFVKKKVQEPSHAVNQSSAKEVFFLVQNDEVVSDSYESIGLLRVVDDRLVYTYEKEGNWYLNINGNDFKTFRVWHNDPINSLQFLNETPLYVGGQDDKVFLVYGDKIVSEQYEGRSGRLSIVDGIAHINYFTVENNRNQGLVEVKVDLSSFTKPDSI